MVFNSEGTAETRLLVSPNANGTTTSTEKPDTNALEFQASFLFALQHSTLSEIPTSSQEGGVLSNPATVLIQPRLPLPAIDEYIKPDLPQSLTQSSNTDQTHTPSNKIPTVQEDVEKTLLNATYKHPDVQLGEAISRSLRQTQIQGEKQRWVESRTDFRPAATSELAMENQSLIDRLPLSSATQSTVQENQGGTVVLNQSIAKNQSFTTVQAIPAGVNVDTSIDAINHHRANIEVKAASVEQTTVANKILIPETQTYIDATPVSTTAKHTSPIYPNVNQLPAVPRSQLSNKVALEGLNHSYDRPLQENLLTNTKPPLNTPVFADRQVTEIDNGKTDTNSKGIVQSTSILHNSVVPRTRVDFQNKEGERVEHLSRAKARISIDAVVSQKQVESTQQMETTRTSALDSDVLKIDHRVSPIAQGVMLSKANDGNRFNYFEPTTVQHASIPPISDQAVQISRVPTAEFVQFQTLNLTSPTLPAGLSHQIQMLLGSGIHSAHIQVNPVELGPVKLDVAITNDQLAVNIATTHLSSRELLEQSLPRLRELLQAQGFEHVDVDVEQHAQKDSTESSSQSKEQNNRQFEFKSPQHSDTTDYPESPQQSNSRSSTHVFDAYA